MPEYNFLADLDNGLTRKTGWVDDPKNVDMVLGMIPSPVFAVAGSTLEDTGKGKVILLSLAVKKIHGKYIILWQKTGDCTSQGAAKATDTVACVQIVQGKRETFKNITATEPIYAGGRIEISNGRFGRGAGCTGAAVARFVNRYGTIPRGVYGSIDLSKYSSQRADSWGMPGRGVPDELEPILAEHTIQTISLIRTYEEARDAIANGYPVTVASNQGFRTTRDRDGCLSPYGNWAHQMCFTGVIDTPKRPRLVCENSWGPDRENGGWVSGPRTFEVEGYGEVEIPEGSFCIDAEICERMFRANDSFAYSGYVGFKVQKDILEYDFLKGE